jgi:maltooligosyltrehalose trehalohydrolase
MPDTWTLERGATVLADSSTRFCVWAPAVESAAVVILQDGGTTEHRMQRRDDGVHETVVAAVGPGSDYLLRLDQGRDRPDPVSRFQPASVHGPSRVVDPRAYAWSDAGWAGLETADLILYEIHVGTFSEEGTFEAVAKRLPYLKELGVTAIELMPVAQFPGRRNWGYDGVHLYAPQNSYGGPQGLCRLVDRAHAEGLAVVLDVVYNHLGPEGNYLAEFGPYFTDRYRTPWGSAINFDGPDSDEVRRYFIENALYWVTEFHIDGLRLDAVHAIFDFGAQHILEELAAVVHSQAEALGRRVQVIAESDLNDPRLVRPPERGGYGLDATWSDDFHHAVHAALTAERNGYYEDFGGVDAVVKAMRDRFVLDGRYSAYRRRRHGAPASDVPRDRFVVFVQNHDQVGNRASGERLSELVAFEQLKLAAALLLLSPYIPLLFMGEEYGEPSPFLYFVDHGDKQLIEAVRRGRRAEFERFAWRGPLPDPAAKETFARSRPDPALAASPPHAELLRLYRELIRIRREEPALRPGAARSRVESDAQAGWLALVLLGGGRDLLAGFNLSNEPTTIETEIPASGWRRRLATDETSYGGSGSEVPSHLLSDAAAPIRLAVPAYTAALFCREDH